jgi:hypothetical protein
MNPLEKELATYNEKLPELLANAGKFVLIHGSDVVDYFDTYRDAMKAGYKAFGLDSFFVKRIEPLGSAIFFSRDIRPCHP